MSLNLKDEETVALISELAQRLGRTKTGVVRELVRERLAALDRETSLDLDKQVAEFTSLLERDIWPMTRGMNAPTKAQREELLGYDEIAPR